MKVISVWQPWTSLLVHGFKIFETRSWPAPQSIIGQRIGIAATKNITPDQRSAFAEAEFERFYALTGLGPLEELPRGMLLGTAQLHACVPVTDELLDDITDEEKAFGWYGPGRYAWRMRDPQPLAHPIPIQGKQGIYDWHGFSDGTPIETTQDPDEEAGRAAEAAYRARAQGLRIRLHTA